jgi:hypothetical protein
VPLVFTPSTPIPRNEPAVREAYWFAVWDRPIAVPFDLQIGGTVYLYDTTTDTLAWRTTLTDTIAVPFEHTDALREHLTRRWGMNASQIVGDTPSPGFAIAWRAEPDELLGITRPDAARALEQWENVHHIDAATREAWALRADGLCACGEPAAA